MYLSRVEKWCQRIHFYDLTSRKFLISRDTIFFEDIFPFKFPPFITHHTPQPLHHTPSDDFLYYRTNHSPNSTTPISTIPIHISPPNLPPLISTTTRLTPNHLSQPLSYHTLYHYPTHYSQKLHSFVQTTIIFARFLLQYSFMYLLTIFTYMY